MFVLPAERAPDYRQRAKEQLAYPGMGESLASTLASFPWKAGASMRPSREHSTLIVWGDQDQTTPYAHASRVQVIYPDAELVTVEGAKHAPHLDHTDIVEPAISRFLEQVEG